MVCPLKETAEIVLSANIRTAIAVQQIPSYINNGEIGRGRVRVCEREKTTQASKHKDEKEIDLRSH